MYAKVRNIVYGLSYSAQDCLQGVRDHVFL